MTLSKYLELRFSIESSQILESDWVDAEISPANEMG